MKTTGKITGGAMRFAEKNLVSPADVAGWLVSAGVECWVWLASFVLSERRWREYNNKTTMQKRQEKAYIPGADKPYRSPF